MRWLTALPIVGVVFGLCAIAIGALSNAQSPNARNREAIFDFYQRIAPKPSAGVTPFHLVEIDRASIDKIGPWPWPRMVTAELVERITASGAKGVIIVEPVDTPDLLSPEVIAAFWLQGAQDKPLAEQLAQLPDTNDALGAALSLGPSSAAVSGGAMPAAQAFSQFDRVDMRAAAGIAVEGDKAFLAMPVARARFPVAGPIARNTTLSVAALPADPDGVVRRAPLVWALEGSPAPSVALEAARLAAPGADAKAWLKPHRTAVSEAGSAIASVTVNGKTTPLIGGAAAQLYTPRRAATAATSAARIFSDATSNAQLAGKVVLIGLSAELGRTVQFASGRVSLAEAHALAAWQIAAGVVLERPVWAGFVEALSVMVLGALAIVWAQKLDFWKAVWLAVCASFLIFAITFAAFSFKSLLIDPLPGALALFLGAFTVAGGRTIGVALRDDAVRGAFHESLPEPAMARIREDGAKDILAGARRPVAVLACDLRILEEDLDRLAGRPEDVSSMIAAAANTLRTTIIKTGGAADQAQGGRIYAYYNAPLETAGYLDAACSAALRLVESMDRINAELEASTRLSGVQIHLAIGASAGECFVGQMGHGRHNRYSAIGGAVDMAAFLRDRAPFYGPAIICDETIYRQTHHHFAYLELDRLNTDKATAPVSIYALVGNPFIKSSKSYRTLDETHRQLLNAYRAGDWDKAGVMLAKARKSPGSAIAFFDIYDQRIRKMAAQGAAPEGWDGVHTVTL